MGVYFKEEPMIEIALISLTVVFLGLTFILFVWPSIRVDKHIRLSDDWDPMESRGRIKKRWYE